jgi:hypothetical protein
METQPPPTGIDDDSRLSDFLARHGGASTVGARRGEAADGLAGWSEIYAADGHVLRCDWVREGGRTEMRYEEHSPLDVPPAA